MYYHRQKTVLRAFLCVLRVLWWQGICLVHNEAFYLPLQIPYLFLVVVYYIYLLLFLLLLLFLFLFLVCLTLPLTVRVTVGVTVPVTVPLTVPIAVNSAFCRLHIFELLHRNF